LKKKQKELLHKKKPGMKKVFIITGVVAMSLAVAGCRKGKRDPGKVYMPDMAYSVAYETYAPTDKLQEKGINYDGTPVPGSVARGDLMSFPLAMDKPGDTANYVASKKVVNPLPPLSATEYLEAARLYLVNCGICHGDKLDGQGPLFKSGAFAAAPKDLIGDPVVSKMPDGQMFYSVTYGIRAMGSYASQLSSKQRWMIIHYIKEKQADAAKTAAGSTTAAPK
jgi:mono/diheme cytochrome c family protein